MKKDFSQLLPNQKAFDAMEELGIEIRHIFAPKRSCPRNNGYFYCDECYDQAVDEATDTDYPCDILEHPFLGCGKEVDSKYCGYTHLGYSWCDECKELGRLECTHYGYEVVRTIIDRGAARTTL